MGHYTIIDGQLSGRYWFNEDDGQRPYLDDLEYIGGQLFVCGRLVHRDDGPAIEFLNGRKRWLKNGMNCGTSIEFTDGTKEWYINSSHEREDGLSIGYEHPIKKANTKKQHLILDDDLLNIFDD